MAFSDQIGRLREDNPSPLYLQLEQLIRDAIGADILAAGNAIPPERDLATEYDVSRITVRKAIGRLVEEGLLTRRRGAGTFVTGRVEKIFSKLSSFTEDMAARGRRASSSWISRAPGQVNPEEAMMLGLSPGAPVLRFARIRYADDEPMALEFSIRSTARSKRSAIGRCARCSGSGRCRLAANMPACSASIPAMPAC
jgi:GntR family transcriptional regulator